VRSKPGFQKFRREGRNIWEVEESGAGRQMGLTVPMKESLRMTIESTTKSKKVGRMHLT
jgi:hypothetical protein